MIEANALHALYLDDNEVPERKNTNPKTVSLQVPTTIIEAAEDEADKMTENDRM